MFIARADNPDEIEKLLERTRLLSEASCARQAMDNGGMLFFDDDPARARALREAAIWADAVTHGTAGAPAGCGAAIDEGQPADARSRLLGLDGQITAAADSALFVADMLDPGEISDEEIDAEYESLDLDDD